MRRLTLLPALILLMSSTVPAATPELRSLRPTGGQRGTEVEVTLSGARLGDAQEILWYQPGIETLALEKIDENKVKAKLKIEPEARLGLYDLRLRTASGTSELRTFSVGQFPEIDEVEPNNDFENPQAIPLNVCVNGVAGNEDDDFYVVEAKKGDRLTAEVEGIRLGITHFDPYVAILDSKRFELATSDDSPLIGVDAVASIIVPEDGKYVIQVRESAYAGNNNSLYRLHVGHFPRPKALVPAGGPLGETVSVQWIGDASGDQTTEVKLPEEPDPTFALFAEDEQGLSPYPYGFRLSPFGNVIEAEPNDSHDQATPFQPPLALNGRIEKPEDVDHFSFKAKKGEKYDISVWARRLGSPLDSVLQISHKGGKQLDSADDNEGLDSYLRFDAPEDGEYVISIRDHLQKGGPDYFYRIEVAPIEPTLTMNVPSEQSRLNVPNVTVNVPQGNRDAVLVYASRKDFGGDLKVDAEALPEGISIQSDIIAANQPVVPVLFEAKADAPIDGLLTRMIGLAADSDAKVPPSAFTHTSVLVFGRNNVSFWQREVDQLAVSVTEESPYSIEVVEPKVPLVNSGTMNLKVVATRKEGFTAPIDVKLPWLPPGLGASGSISIPEGENEVVIPMNANGAEARSWKLVVVATSNTPGGPVQVSSQLFNLEVSQPYLQFAYTNAACEQGQSTDLAIKVTKLKDFPGEAKVTLVGLPNKAEAEPQTITEETTDLVFPITTTEETPAGKHGNLFCEVVITEHGEPITHNLGKGELRVDKPIAPKPDAVAAKPKPEPKADAPAKPLSRLEQLRLEAAERAQSEAEGSGGEQ